MSSSVRQKMGGPKRQGQERTYRLDSRDVPLCTTFIAWMFESDLVESIFEVDGVPFQGVRKGVKVVEEGLVGDETGGRSGMTGPGMGEEERASLSKGDVWERGVKHSVEEAEGLRMMVYVWVRVRVGGEDEMDEA